MEMVFHHGNPDHQQLSSDRHELKIESGFALGALGEQEKATLSMGGTRESPNAVDQVPQCDLKKTQHQGSATVPFHRLFSYASGLDYGLMLMGTVGAIVNGISLPILLLILGKIVNSFGVNANNLHKLTHDINKLCTSLVYLGLLLWVSSWIEVSCWMQAGERQAAKIRVKYLESILRQDIVYFDTEALKVGDLIESISIDTIAIQEAIGEKMGTLIHFWATFLGGFLVGFLAAWRIALVTLAVLPLFALAGLTYTFLYTNLSSKSQEAYGSAGIIAEQVIAQIRTIYSFVGEDKAAEAYSNALTSGQKAGYRAALMKGLGFGIMFMIVNANNALLFWYGGIVVLRGASSGGQIMTAIFSVVVGGMALGQAAPSLTALGKGKAAAQKIFFIIDRSPNISKRLNCYQLEDLGGQIEFKEVDFSYPTRPDVPILQKFCLTFPHGETTAVVGRSGSGKSTLISLIMRFYHPMAGEILVDGHNIQGLKLKWLRQQIGLVSQEPVLFATTIRDNILLGRDDASQEEIEQVAKLSSAHTFICNLPDQYATQVGERGVQLSGGQKQRIAIARAMLRNPVILLLDEATSALDAASEVLVKESLDSFMTGRTTIVVAHRLSTIQNVHSIVVMDEGHIVEIGTHSDLMSKGTEGAYHQLFKLQEIGWETPEVDIPSPSRNSDSTLSENSPISSVSSSPVRSPSQSGANLHRQLNYNKGDHDSRAPSASFWRLINMNLQEWPYALLGTIGSVLCGAQSPGFSFTASTVIGVYYYPDHSYVKEEVRKYAFVFIGISVGSMFAQLMQHYFWGLASENLTKRVRERMFAGLLKNEVSWFDREENSSNQVNFRLASDSTNLKVAVGDKLALIIQSLSLLVVACSVGFYLSWRMALVTLAVSPAVFAAFLFQTTSLRGFSGDVQKAVSRATMIAGEAVSNIRTVAAFNARKRMVKLFANELKIAQHRSFHRGQIAGFGYGISQLFLYSALALTLWYASVIVKHGEGNFKNVFRVFFILMIAAVSISESLALVPDILRGGDAIKSAFKVMDRESKIETDDPTGLKADKINGEIEFKSVRFYYPTRPDVSVLKDLSLLIPAGSNVAIVGASGSGKSTIIALIERFYDPVKGMVMIDGNDIRSYNLKSLRRHIALVQQEPALFATTIYENITYGKECATEGEVVEAARLANAHGFISGLPEAYKTRVGERGVLLSGGQKQRVGIARALLKGATIVLLDEATSALDAASEGVVQEGLEEMVKGRGRTVVVVAHRLSTVRKMDEIVVVENGRVVERGKHEDMVGGKGKGAYAQLVNMQGGGRRRRQRDDDESGCAM